MELFNQIIEYFGLHLISEAETFPELLEFSFQSVFALFLVVMIFRVIFKFMGECNRLMER